MCPSNLGSGNQTEQSTSVSGPSARSVYLPSGINVDQEVGHLFRNNSTLVWNMLEQQTDQQDADQDQIWRKCSPGFKSRPFYFWFLCLCFLTEVRRMKSTTPSTLWRRKTCTCSTDWKTWLELSEIWNTCWWSTQEVNADYTQINCIFRKLGFNLFLLWRSIWGKTWSRVSESLEGMVSTRWGLSLKFDVKKHRFCCDTYVFFFLLCRNHYRDSPHVAADALF